MGSSPAPSPAGPPDAAPAGAVPSGPAPVAGCGEPAVAREHSCSRGISEQEAPSGPAPMGIGVPQPVKSPAQVVTGEGAAAGSGTPHIDDLLRLMLERGGSDLHITVGSPAGMRLRGEIISLEDASPLSPRVTMEMLLGLLSEEQRRRFENELELDFAYSIPGVSRFRANIFQQRGPWGRSSESSRSIPTIADLGLPKVCQVSGRPSARPRAVTGPTGSGKSTTLAAMVDHINGGPAGPHHHDRGSDRVPAPEQEAYVNQREIGEDTHWFAPALKRSCARTLTSSSLARCETWRPSRRRSPRPRPAISFSRRCTPPVVPRPSTASSTCSRRTSRSRSACSSPSPSRE